MKTSILVPTWNLKDKLDRCLTSVYKYTDMDNVQLVIADNGSTDGTHEMVMDKHFREGNDVYLRFAENHGFAKATNLAAASADGELLLMLNNDVYVAEEGWLENMLSCMYNGSDIVGHKLLYENDTIQHIGLSFLKEEGMPYHLYRNEPDDNLKYGYDRTALAVSFACALVSKNIYGKLAGLDENYSNGYEDIDMCLKLSQYGGKISVACAKKIYHDECSTVDRHKYEKENAMLFITKWHKPLFGLQNIYNLQKAGGAV